MIQLHGGYSGKADVLDSSFIDSLFNKNWIKTYVNIPLNNENMKISPHCESPLQLLKVSWIIVFWRMSQ